jgi:hypothetical protein
VNEQVAELVEAMEGAENRKVGRKERKEIQDKVVLELLPRAFSKASSTYAYIDTRKGWLVVDASGSNKAEDVVSLIRKAMESLPVVTLRRNGARVFRRNGATRKYRNRGSNGPQEWADLPPFTTGVEPASGSGLGLR